MKRRKGDKVLPPVHPNVGIEADYRRRLLDLIDDMQASYRHWLTARYRRAMPLAMDARRRPRFQEQIEEYRNEGIFLKEGDTVDTDTFPIKDFDGTTIKSSQNTVESRGVAIWRRRIRAGERPAVLLEEIAPGRFRIVDGHHRATAYADLGIKNVPVIIKNALPPSPLPAEQLSQQLRALGADWEKRFDETAPKLARWFAQSAGRRSQDRLQKILREGGISVRFQMTPAVRNVVEANIAENVGLIRSIASRYHGDVQGMVMRSVAAGRDVGALTAELEDRYRITRRRAAGIALDQNNKATADIVRARQSELGLGATWLHSAGGKKPRKTHVANSGKTYDPAVGWFDPDPKVRKRIWPGQLINCRCVSRTVVKGFS